MLKLVIGLGNPGKEYENSRHNLGYRLIDLLVKRKKGKLKPGKGEYFYSEIKIDDQKVILAKPTTFMNMSGWAVVDCLGDFGLKPENLFVLCDDVNLPLGKIRLREKGTAGGHKGLRSIIYQLNTIDFARLRMGVGLPEEKIDLEEYVLRDFQEEEKDIVDKMLETSAEAVEVSILYGIEKGMSRFNQQEES
jgi:PTH1 family peptidyl-tRNA hydrolase